MKNRLRVSFSIVLELYILSVQAYAQIIDNYLANWTKKPAFEVLDWLINKEWRTNITATEVIISKLEPGKKHTKRW